MKPWANKLEAWGRITYLLELVLLSWYHIAESMLTYVRILSYIYIYMVSYIMELQLMHDDTSF